ncbi:MAG TPA: hypothetical protein VM097_13720 [Mycobacteriales bacterium]|nr:hypothetical protein [Mycobacteriales bacterium]
MAESSKYKVPVTELDKVHVPAEDLVEEHDVTPPVPDAKGDDERARELILRIGAPGI